MLLVLYIVINFFFFLVEVSTTEVIIACGTVGEGTVCFEHVCVCFGRTFK